MKFLPKHILIGLALALFAYVGTVSAQESSFSTSDSVEPEKEKYVPSIESEKVQIKKDTALVVRPTVAPKTKAADNTKAGEKQQQPREGSSDSVLSFNFLYYFIQKFKMSDISDQ